MGALADVQMTSVLDIYMGYWKSERMENLA
jgi:hypothetical protein